MKDGTQESTENQGESSDSSANANDSLRQLIGCAQSLPRGDSCSDEEEWINLQSESMVCWAKRNGRLLDPVAFKKLTASLKMFEGGFEHQVFYYPKKTGRVLKVTKPPYFGIQIELLKYAQNALWANLLFSDSIRFEGILQVAEGVSVVISQPVILGRSPTLEEIAEWFEEQGYVSLGNHQWKGPNGEIISDAHAGNFVYTSDDHLIPVDLQINNPGHGVPHL